MILVYNLHNALITIRGNVVNMQYAYLNSEYTGEATNKVPIIKVSNITIIVVSLFPCKAE